MGREHHQGVQAAGQHARPGAMGDLQPPQPREPRLAAEHERAQRPLRDDWIDAGRRRGQSRHRAGWSARDAVGDQSAVLIGSVFDRHAALAITTVNHRDHRDRRDERVRPARVATTAGFASRRSHARVFRVPRVLVRQRSSL